MIYLDNSATTRPYDAVIEKMTEQMREGYGNPSSLYSLGIAAEKAIKEARKQVAQLMGVPAERVYFTSGGTEGDNTAVFGAAAAMKRRGRRIITTAVEHPAVLEAFRKLEEEGFAPVYVGVDRDGIVDLQALQAALNKETILVSVMAVNNETGAIMPLAEIRNTIDRFNEQNGTKVLLHTDMVQSFGKVRDGCAYADIATVSAHKIHGPKGCGAIYIKKGVNIPAFLVGGGQEAHFRSGTENVPAIAGFGVAAQLALENFERRTASMREARARLLEGIRAGIADIKVNSFEETALDFSHRASCCAVLNISFRGTRGEVILHKLESKGIYVSTGSACSSNKKGRSHVLTAMKLSDAEIEGAIRFSLSEFTTIAEIDETVACLQEAVAEFRRLGSFR